MRHKHFSNTLFGLLVAGGIAVGFLFFTPPANKAMAATCAAGVSGPRYLTLGQTGSATLSLTPSDMSGGSINYLGGAPSGVTLTGSGSRSVSIQVTTAATQPGTLRFQLVGGKQGSSDCAGGSVDFQIREGTSINCFDYFSPFQVTARRSTSISFSGKYPITQTGSITVQPASVGSVSNITTHGATFVSSRDLEERVSLFFSGWQSSAGSCMSETMYLAVVPNCDFAASVYFDGLQDKEFHVGDRILVRAPAGWRWGHFYSSDPNIIVVNELSSGEAEVIAVGTGTASVYGSGWTAANGAKMCSLRGASLTVLPPPVPPACPDPLLYQVDLRKAEIVVGESTEVLLPLGWSGGTLRSSSSAVARLQETPDGKFVAVGVGVGLASITGEDFTADNGAQGCNLGPGHLEVKPAPSGKVAASPNPLELCAGTAVGQTTVTFSSNVFYELRVIGAQGVADNTVVDSGGPVDAKQYLSGAWVRDGTKFVLVAAQYNEQLIAEAAVQVTTKDCAEPPSGGPPGGSPATLKSQVYNSLTVPASFGTVPNCTVLAVWSYAGPADSFRVTNLTTSESWQAGAGLARLQVAPSNPQAVSDYEVAAIKAGQPTVKSRPDFSPLAPTYPCGGQGPRFGTSNKDVVKIRNTDLVSDTFAKAEANLPKGMKVFEGDTVRFAVNIINSGDDAFTGVLTVDDVFLNLTRPEAGWGESMSCGGNCEIESLTYSDSTKKLSFRIRAKGAGLLPYHSTGNAWILSFNAVPKAPQNAGSQLFFFQNIASINGVSHPGLITPKVPFLRAAENPTIIEVQ